MSDNKIIILDGILMTTKEFHEASIKATNEGRKIVAIDDMEWVTEDREMDRETMTRLVKQVIDGQTVSTFPTPERARSDEPTVGGQEMEDRIGQETGQGLGMMSGQMTVTDATVTPDGQTLTGGRKMTTDEQMMAKTVMEEPMIANKMEETFMAAKVDLLASSPAASLVVSDPMVGQCSAVDTLSASPSSSRHIGDVVVVGDGSNADMQVEVDPLMCPLSSSFLSADETDLGPIVGTPKKLASGTPATPRSLFLSVEESTPSVSGQTRDMSVVSGVDMKADTITSSKKVAGRRHAVIDDDGESSSVSATSVGLDSSSMASSSRVLRKGTKRGREVLKGKDFDREGTLKGSSEEDKRKKKGKKKDTTRKETPEERVSCGPYGEPKGLVEHALEDMSSAVLSAAMMDWASKIDEIRIKSKNIQGRLSGEIKNYLKKIKEGTILMGIRLESTGDPHFLRMRNAELASQLKEAKGENARLEEQLRRVSSGTPSPLRKRRATKAAAALDVSQGTAVDLSLVTESRVLPSSIKEAFPPLPQRLPRGVNAGRGGDRVLSAVRVPSPPSMVNRGSEDVETGTEAYIRQQIKDLVADLEKEKKRKKEYQGKEHLDSRDDRKGVTVDKDREKDVSGKRQIGDGRVGPRIISNVQLVPSYKERLKDEASSSAISASETGWRVVGGRRRKDSPLVRNSKMDPRALLRDADVSIPPPGWQPKPKVKVPRPPLSSVVTITGRTEDFSYAAALRNARESIDLKALGISLTRVRKALNGGLLIEVSGEGSRAKAEELVTRVRDVLKDSAVVSCPTKKRELRVVGFDESVSAEEIMEALSKIGECSVAEVKIGPLRTLSNGLGSVWAQLPVAAAVKVANEERIQLGWTIARVELLDIRPLQCFRCWSYGHVQNTCRSMVDRRSACFKCGKQGHMASKCENVAHCVLCHEAGLETAHRLGGPSCMARAKK